MGQIIRARCESCGFQKDLFAGSGRSDCDRETILSALPEPERNTLAAALSRGARAYVTRKCAQCFRCKSVYVLPVVEYEENGREEALSGGCPKCGGTVYMELLEQSRGVKRCPECGGSLTLLQAGHWD